VWTRSRASRRWIERSPFAHVRDRRTTVDFLGFMDDVVKSYPLGELHVVLDNLNIHKNEAAKQWLLRHPRVH